MTKKQPQVVHALLGLVALCHGASALYEHRAEYLETRQQSDSGRLSINPNPCHDSTFVAPVYAIKNATASKTFYPIATEGPSHVNFTVADIANNYTLDCRWAQEYALVWGREGEGPFEIMEVQSDCVPTNDPDVHRFHNLFSTELSNSSTIRMAQIWICNDATGGAFPYVVPRSSIMESVLTGLIPCFHADPSTTRRLLRARSVSSAPRRVQTQQHTSARLQTLTLRVCSPFGQRTKDLPTILP